MPQYNGLTIENLKPLEALKRGYLSYDEAKVSSDWVEAKFEVRHSNTIIYVNGRYRGVATTTFPLHKIVSKFNL